MSLPSRITIELPLLTELAGQGGSSTPDIMYQRLGKHFHLTADDLEITTNDGKEPVFFNTVRQARRTLVEKKEIDNSIHGLWRLTTKGYNRIGQTL